MHILNRARKGWFKYAKTPTLICAIPMAIWPYTNKNLRENVLAIYKDVAELNSITIPIIYVPCLALKREELLFPILSSIKLEYNIIPLFPIISWKNTRPTETQDAIEYLLSKKAS